MGLPLGNVDAVEVKSVRADNRSMQGKAKEKDLEGVRLWGVRCKESFGHQGHHPTGSDDHPLGDVLGQDTAPEDLLAEKTGGLRSAGLFLRRGPQGSCNTSGQLCHPASPPAGPAQGGALLALVVLASLSPSLQLEQWSRSGSGHPTRPRRSGSAPGAHMAQRGKRGDGAFTSTWPATAQVCFALGLCSWS